MNHLIKSSWSSWRIGGHSQVCSSSQRLDTVHCGQIHQCASESQCVETRRKSSRSRKPWKRQLRIVFIHRQDCSTVGLGALQQGRLTQIPFSNTLLQCCVCNQRHILYERWLWPWMVTRLRGRQGVVRVPERAESSASAGTGVSSPTPRSKHSFP